MFVRCNSFADYMDGGKSKIIKCKPDKGVYGHKVFIRDDRIGNRTLRLCEVEVFGPARPICEEPPKISNGFVFVISPSIAGISDESQQLIYSCNPGYELWGKKNLYCQNNNR